MNPEERKDVFEDVTFVLARKEKEQERRQRERNCLHLAKILSRINEINYRTTWAKVVFLIMLLEVVFYAGSYMWYHLGQGSILLLVSEASHSLVMSTGARDIYLYTYVKKLSLRMR